MNLKTRGKTEELKKAMKALLVKFDADQIFNELVSCSEHTPDINYLTDEVITYLQIYQNMNCIKIEGLNQQLEFEAAIENIIPHYNDQRNNLFLKL